MRWWHPASLRSTWRGCDSVWVDFTKGLGAPLGAVLCGSEAFIDEAWRWKQRLGGSMRRPGSAPSMHLRAGAQHRPACRRPRQRQGALARGPAQVPGITVEEPETNLVFFDTSGVGMTADQLAEKRVRREGIMLSAMGAIAHAPVRISM